LGVHELWRNICGKARYLRLASIQGDIDGNDAFSGRLDNNRQHRRAALAQRQCQVESEVLPSQFGMSSAREC